jgi:hypothetical protein
VRRRNPIAWVEPDGLLVEGVLNLTFEDEDDRWVLDFKTGEKLSSAEDRYPVRLASTIAALTKARQ